MERVKQQELEEKEADAIAADALGVFGAVPTPLLRELQCMYRLLDETLRPALTLPRTVYEQWSLWTELKSLESVLDSSAWYMPDLLGYLESRDDKSPFVTRLDQIEVVLRSRDELV